MQPAVPSLGSRLRLAEVITRRPRGNLLIGLLLAFGFALLVTPVVIAESWLVDGTVTAGQKAPVTVRVRAFDGYDNGNVVGRGGSVVVARGDVATEEQASLAAAARRDAPRGLGGFAAYFAVLFVLAAGVTHHLRRSNRGRLLRVQLVLLGTVAAGAILTKTLLLLWPVSVLAVPVALGAVVPTLVYDRTVGLAGGVLAAVVMSLLVPFDVGVSTVLVVQAVAAAIVIPERARPRMMIAMLAGAMAVAGAVLTYAAFSYLSNGVVPTSELSDPLKSSWLASAVGGVMAGLLALPVLSLFQMACGEITQGKLVALEDLSHPLLKQIAEKAPGTWQHSLAMANMADLAANAIGADGRLVRVGAYFHDLGKSLQPPYFIENLQAGDASPHDRLAPEVSCDAIFAHVTEGIALARRQKLPERIIDFMHMHHGDGVLEYFWAKCQEQGNPRKLSVDDFRYPGVPPQSRETAILAICDAVEAASRTIKRPDERSIENLVQRIVYGKLHLGQLDESGLSMGDLRRINNSLKETIKHAHHGRIEYPWQREAAAAEAAGQDTGPTVGMRAPTATQRLMQEPRLDSLDVPRPLEWEDTGRPRTPIPVPPPPTTTAPAPAPAPAPQSAGEVGFSATMPMTQPQPQPQPQSQPQPQPEPIVPYVNPVQDTVSLRPVGSDGPTYVGPALGAPIEPAVAEVVPPMPLPAPRPTNPQDVILLTPEMAAPHAVTEPMFAQNPSVTGPMAAVTPSAADSMPVMTPIALHAGTTGPIVMPPETSTSTLAGFAGVPLGPVPTTLTGTAGPLRRPATASGSGSSMTSAGTPPPADSVNAPTEERPIFTTLPPPPPPPPAAPKPTTVHAAVPPPPPGTPEPDARSSWASTLAARLDTMMDEDDDAFAAEPTKRQPPPPPPTRKRVTHEVDAEDVEATIELSPHARPEPSGLIVGPPPATRPTRPVTTVSDTGFDGDEGPTVVRKPASSGLPPRARKSD
ncbi:MAG TPA: HDIG domain-containing protein [Kofleriaceae bacterium]|nr:HDIG domain-containing protein [Kofleriaceae bacterium]